MHPTHAPLVTHDVVDSVATITLNRPPVNAVNPELIEALLPICREVAADPEVRCIVLTGAGRQFVAGADINVMNELTEESQLKMHRWTDVLRCLEEAPKPVIAGINGHALGGGAELTLACDLRLASSRATIGFPEISLGLFPGAGGSVRLPRLIGAHRAALAMIEGTRFRADDALNQGLVDKVVPEDQFDEELVKIAAEFAAKPTRAIGEIKRLVRISTDRSLAEAEGEEFQAVLRLLVTDDLAEGFDAFLQKRKPVFKGQ